MTSRDEVEEALRWADAYRRVATAADAQFNPVKILAKAYREQEKEIEALRKALLAKMSLEGRGGHPIKLDEALAWKQNDDMAERLAQEALALHREKK